MEAWQLIVAVIQGLVEWLPISSEGQAVLFVYNFGNIPVSAILSLVIWLHLGTALAVIVRYPRDMLNIISLRDPLLFRQLFVATAATAITALPLYFLLKETFTVFQGEILNLMVGILLILTGIILYLPKYNERNGVVMDLEELSARQAALTGLVQGFSILPGLSRSGLTISALLMQKVEKTKALRFSFLMSVPAVLGILVIELLSGVEAFPPLPWSQFIIMIVIVFISGLASMEFLLRIANRINFWKFCLIIGCIAVLFAIPALI